MNSPDQFSNAKSFVARALETTIHVGLVILLLFWCFQIGRPFIQIIVWGIIIAVAKGCKPAGPHSISRNQKCLVL
jgi:hypothetical protein